MLNRGLQASSNTKFNVETYSTVSFPTFIQQNFSFDIIRGGNEKGMAIPTNYNVRARKVISIRRKAAS